MSGPTRPSGASGAGDGLDAASPALGALDEVLRAALALARTEPSLHAIALVGSCARGTPGPDADVDLVILSAEPDDLCRRGDSFTHFGSVTLVGQRQFGDVTERRLRRGDGLDIEIGLAPPSWAETGSGGRRDRPGRAGGLLHCVRSPRHPGWVGRSR